MCLLLCVSVAVCVCVAACVRACVCGEQKFQYLFNRNTCLKNKRIFGHFVHNYSNNIHFSALMYLKLEDFHECNSTSGPCKFL